MPGLPNRHLTTTLAALGLAALTYRLQQTMVVPALPLIQEDLDTTTVWATWIFTGLLLTSSADTIGSTGVPAEPAYTTMFWLCSAAAAVAALLGLTILPRSIRRRRAAALEAAR